MKSYKQLYKPNVTLTQDEINYYLDGATLGELAEVVGTSGATARTALIYQGVKLRTPAEAMRISERKGRAYHVRDLTK